MLTVPLVHVHPDADHLHGQAGHLHGGTVHTVWSPDLDGEFDSHRQVDQPGVPSQDGRTRVAPSPHTGAGYTELGFSVLTDSTDRKSLKPFATQALGCSPTIDLDVERYVRRQEHTTSIQPSVPVISTRASRAPPRPLV
jgi:hypothetical protein